MKTPIVLIVFKRPDTTKQVFEAIRKAKPSKLFVIADGPRCDRPGEAEKCAETREIIDRVDWDCEVIKDYSEVNLGCGKRIYTGLNWVFAQVEEAIILEDDCIPHPTFFRFCEELLERYRTDDRINSISAQNFAAQNQSMCSSYYFSRYPHSWGWATWRRAWKHFDFEMTQWEKLQRENFLTYYLKDDRVAQAWQNTFEATYHDHVNIWDYQWLLSCWLQDSLSIHPKINLVTNIGLGKDATNTMDENSKFASLPISAMQFPLKHPSSVTRNVQSDACIQKEVFDISWLRRLKNRLRIAFRDTFNKVDRATSA